MIPVNFFGVSSITVLTLINKDGIHLLKKKVDAITNIPVPALVRKLQKFLINLYTRFISNCTETIFPPTVLLRNRKTKNESLFLTLTELQFFNDIKEKLTEDTLLARPMPDVPLSLIVGASDVGIGWGIAKVCSRCLATTFLFSNRFEPVETQYSMFGGELLAAY